MTDQPVPAATGEAQMDGPNTHRMDAPLNVTDWTVIPTTRSVPTDDGRSMEDRAEWWHLPTFVVDAILAPAPTAPAGLREALDRMDRTLPQYVDMDGLHWWPCKSVRDILAAIASPSEEPGLEQTAHFVIAVYDTTHLRHDTAYEELAEALEGLRARLAKEPGS